MVYHNSTLPLGSLIITIFLTLFILFQVNISSFNYFPLPTPNLLASNKPNISWESNWTNIYLPLLLPLH